MIVQAVTLWDIFPRLVRAGLVLWFIGIGDVLGEEL
jgi:hypothetical protein